MRRLAAALAVAIALGACGGSGTPEPELPDTIGFSSPAFEPGGAIPVEFTCKGPDRSPPLRIEGVAEGTVELVVTMRDRDAPGRDFTHWLMWGIEPSAAVVATGLVPIGAAEGRNDFGKDGYGGPCPPAGAPHTYVFTVYSLTARSGLRAGASHDDVLRAVARAGSAKGEFTGTFRRG